MGIALTDDTSYVAIGNATGGSRINDVFTTSGSASFVMNLVVMKGDENPDPATPSSFDLTGTNQPGTLIVDSGSTGSNNDIRILAYGYANPGDVTNANVRFDNEFTANGYASIWVAFTGSIDTSVAAATSAISPVVNTSANSATVLTTCGVAGSIVIALCGGYGNDMSPSACSGFTEVIDAVSSATVDDVAFNFSWASAPAATTCTWSATDQNAGVLIELKAPAGSTVAPIAFYHYRNHGQI